jgi:flavin reductase (DIM6/NTAB) family NADH-FMN oxidoreductase RutF
MHRNSHPSILYFGTPVVLIGTTNEDGSYNLAPMSSIFWLGWRCMIGLASPSKTTQNIIRTGHCVLNLPSSDLVGQVNLLARTTGSNPIPGGKILKGYRYEKDKFGIAGLTPQSSETVDSPRVLECPVQMEAVVEAVHGLAENDPRISGNISVIELRIHLEESIIMEGSPNRVDPDKWRPLIMSFQEFYGLGPKLQESTLAKIPETMYKTPDIEKARKMMAEMPVV